jgi:aerobic-type carbon monoxide dehydrogenase small subunit (CoxS/CutS family)
VTAKIELSVDGEVRSVDVEDDETLLDTLRERLGDTSTRYACGIGVCGACTVLVDGDCISSCLQLATMVEGREIQTPEHALTRPGSLGERVVRAFVESSAFQCSYCIPAMALTVAQLLGRDEHVTSEEVREALGGNLCRCGSYPQILSAVSDLIAQLSSPESEG